MNTQKISVIIPVYNAEKYLERCVNSILAQTYPNFELLLIDDGSVDESGRICEDYVKKDSRVKAFHKKNGGVSAARNLGLLYAEGEFVVFCDSDDWVEPNYLEVLYPKKNEDLVCCSCHRTVGNSLLMVESSNIKDILNKNTTLYIFGCVWGKLYKNSLIKKNKISFKEDILMGEDIIFVLEYLCSNLKSVVTKSTCAYIYNNINETSLSRQLIPEEQSYQIMELLFEKFNKLSLLYGWKNKNIVNEYLCSQFFNIINTIRHSGNSIQWRIRHLFHAINNKHVHILLADHDYWNSRKSIVLKACLRIIRLYYYLEGKLKYKR